MTTTTQDTFKAGDKVTNVYGETGVVREVIEKTALVDNDDNTGNAQAWHVTKTSAAVRLDDSAYLFAHGKAPRGSGSWAFGPKKNTDSMECKFFSGTLTEAKKAARI